MSNRKYFSIGRMTELGHRLLRKIVESPSLEVLKQYLDMILINCLWEALLEKENCKGQLQFQLQSFVFMGYICVYIYVYIEGFCVCMHRHAKH